MKKKLVIVMMALGILSACSNKEPREEKREITPIKSAQYKKLPDWVLQPEYSKGIAAIGQAKIGQAGLSFAKTEALANARNELARQIGVQVDNMFTSYVNTTGIGPNQTLEKVATDVSKQVASVSLKGSKQLNVWISEDEEVYVLVGVDNSVVNEQAKTTLNNELAMYQEFKANKAQEELAKEIDKEFK